MAVDLTRVTDELNTEPLIRAEVSKVILEEVPHQSNVLPKTTRLRDLATREMEMIATEMIPYVQWIGGGDLKPISGISWDKRKMVVREIAVIIPIRDDLIADAQGNGFNIWNEVRKWVSHSAAATIDRALLWGTDVPPVWDMDNIYDIANAAGSVMPSTGDLYQDLLGEDGILTKVELDEYDANYWMSSRKLKGKLRGVVDATGQPLFLQDSGAPIPRILDQIPIDITDQVIWDNDKASVIVGDFSQFVYAMRQDITFTPFTEGVISDVDGRVVLNLMQQDMSALRMVMRLAWGCPIKFKDGLTTADRSPFAVLSPA